MPRHLEARRRILIVAYQRYLAADRALEAAKSAALSWFPESPSRKAMLIGDPGSRIRRLYEHRDRSLARLTLARQALEEAQDRLSKRHARMVYLIGVQ